MKELRSVKGMHDIMPDEMPKWHFVERSYRSLVERYGYREIRTPVLEPIELFVRGIGEATDIVEKEMYAFEDKGGDHLGLRPEGTASAIRAYIQHGVQASEQLTKWYYVGPMFRRERPAKGRYRQFHQAGAELVGTRAPAADAEIIDMAVDFIASIGVKDVHVLVNTLGDQPSRNAFRTALVEHYDRQRAALCGDCVRRLEVNPLRVLDCKVESCRELARGAPSVLDLLSAEASEHFDAVRRLLDRFRISYTVNPSMVRGLDYYTGTIFEVQASSESLGAQTAIVGGGRYDNLIEELGGRPTPAIGFSFGIERLILVLGDAAVANPTFPVYVTGVGFDGLDRAITIARQLRAQGLPVEVPYTEGSLKSHLKRADRLGCKVVIIAGEDEAKRGAATLREMQSGRQEEIQFEKLLESVKELS